MANFPGPARNIALVNKREPMKSPRPMLSINAYPFKSNYPINPESS